MKKTPGTEGNRQISGSTAHAAADRPRLPPATGHPASAELPAIASETLLQGHTTVQIVHNGLTYRLQATRQGRLILTK